jgi:hypothetical protein
MRTSEDFSTAKVADSVAKLGKAVLQARKMVDVYHFQAVPYLSDRERGKSRGI